MPVITRTNTEGWSDEKLELLAHLSEVKAPIYTFSGVVGSKPTSGVSLPSSGLEPSRSAPPLPGNVQSLFQDGMRAYVEKRYGDAETLLWEAHKLALGADEITFYPGICKLMNWKPNEAWPMLEFVFTTDTVGVERKSPYGQAAHFFCGKAYLQELLLSEAEKELEKAAALPGPLRTDAQSTLTQLRTLLATGKEDKKLSGLDKPN